MQVLKTGTRVRYHSEPTWHGTVIKSRITGTGDDAEPEYTVRWDFEDADEGPSQAWPCEIVPA